MKKVYWNRSYDGPVSYIAFRQLKEGMRIYFQVVEWNRPGNPLVTLEGTITGLKRFGYAKKASVKVYDEKIGTYYISARKIIRILEESK